MTNADARQEWMQAALNDEIVQAIDALANLFPDPSQARQALGQFVAILLGRVSSQAAAMVVGPYADHTERLETLHAELGLLALRIITLETRMDRLR
jgi:hypothetical protein